MKVVLFCGGYGVRMRDFTHNDDANIIPKPLIQVGSKPLIWHIMKYYSFFGHKDFILTLGYKSENFVQYFDNELDEDWNVTLIDTGLDSNIGQRLYKIKEEIDDDYFLANYTDGLSDLNLNLYIDEFLAQKKAVASFMSYSPTLQFHTTTINRDGKVKSINPPSKLDSLWINAGFFIFKKNIFDYINYGEELVEEPLNRLCSEEKLISYKHSGFWKNIDNYKDLQVINELYQSKKSPWIFWKEKD